MRNNAISQKRQNKIMEYLQAAGEVSVNEISTEFNVTPITIRRDLDALSEKGMLERIHGGAILTKKLRDEALFTEKGIRHISEKSRIGKAAAALINENDTVFLNSGSTTLEVLKNLKGKNVRVITNNVAAINVERDPLVELFLVGGEYREASRSLIGDLAQETLSHVISSCTILGANGISKSFGLTSSVQQETSVNRLMVERCHGPVIVLADSSKIGIVSNFPTATIDQVSILITDEKADKEQISSFETLGIKVIIA
jgi:DeoR family fructose operon transcriptional repressor